MRKLLLALSLLLLSHAASAEIQFDATSSGQGAAPSTLTFAHTCTGGKLALYVFVVCHAADSVTGVTYNGVAMQTMGDEITSGTFRMSSWYLSRPSVGTYSVVVTFSVAAVDGLAISVSYRGVPNDIANSLPPNSWAGLDDDSNGASSGSSTSATSTQTANYNNDLFVQGVFSSVTATDIVPGGAQIERADLTQSTVRLEVNDNQLTSSGSKTSACVVGNGAWLSIGSMTRTDAPKLASIGSG